MARTAPAAVLIGLLMLGGCAEMQRPAPLSRIPPGLGVVAADPVPAIAAEAAAAFGDAGRSLAGNPAVSARAVGQAEILAAELRGDPRWAPVGAPVETELRTARLEWRAALGIRAGAAPEAVAAALGRAALALRANDTRGAAAALDPALFEPGGVVTLARLAAPGPLPQSRLATAAARDGIARIGRQRLVGPLGALDPEAGLLGGLAGQDPLEAGRPR